jgi:hypothetical protein
MPDVGSLIFFCGERPYLLDRDSPGVTCSRDEALVDAVAVEVRPPDRARFGTEVRIALSPMLS